MGLILLKKNAVVFKRSKFDNDDTQHAGDPHVEIRADSWNPNVRVLHNEIKPSPCAPQNEMNISDMDISLLGDKERSRETGINVDHDNVYTKELEFMNNLKKDNNKNSEYLKDSKASRMELQFEESDKSNVNYGEAMDTVSGDAAIPNDMSYHTQVEASACAGKIEMVNPNSRVFSQESNGRKWRKALNMQHYYRHTKKFQLIHHDSENKHRKKDESLMDNMEEKVKLGYGEKGELHLVFKDGKDPVLQSVSSVDRKHITSPKTRSKRNDSNAKSEGQDKKNEHGGRYKRTTNYIGVTDYKRTKKWQAFIWITNGYQRSLGYHYIPEAAARASDKAHLVLRSPSRRKLNFPEADYDIKRIEEFRLMSEEEFVQMLCIQSTNYSEACVDGLNEEAARQLLEIINKEKQARL
ncbi:hypothetical protein SUGI_0458360 [Cryptomeria japonica]|nr:hypothetical protein SUGI_0458360 [Cryptomeria japonica]